MRKQVIWSPQPKQAFALQCDADEMLYGGAAGGGKSDFLLMDFYAGVNIYGEAWAGIIFRQTNPQLGELIKRAKQLYPPLGAQWMKTEKTFVFPTGATLKMRYLERDEDVEEYQGHQYTWIGFDELGNYKTDYCYTYMFSRNRSAAGARCYVRASANPGGSGHNWLKRRFIDGFLPNKIYWHKLEEMKKPKSRIFIPAKLEDNQILMQNDEGYEDNMAYLPSHLYKALRHGSWDVIAGQVFDKWNRDVHVIKPIPLPNGEWYKFYSMDWGYAKPFSIGKWAVNSSGRMIRYGEWYGCVENKENVGIKMGAEQVAETILKDAINEGVTEMVADPAIWNKQDDAPSIADKFEAVGFSMNKANNDRINGLVMMHQRMITLDEDKLPMILIFDTCLGFIRTVPLLLPDKNKPEDVDSDMEDHIYDEARYAIMSDFAHNPVSALRKQNGNWTFNSKPIGKSWDPLE
jgi:hypothetical protein